MSSINTGHAFFIGIIMKEVSKIRETGITVSTNQDLITLESKKPFIVIKQGKRVPAQVNENGDTFSLKVNGLVVNGTVGFDVVLAENTPSAKTTSFPLLNKIMEQAKPLTTLAQTNVHPFESLQIGEQFKLVGNDTVFVKTGKDAYAKHGKLLNVNSIQVNEWLNVVVENKFNVLTPDQLRDIVAHLPQGADEDELFEIIHSMLDDVAGFEDPDSRDDVVDTILSMYHEVHNQR